MRKVEVGDSYVWRCGACGPSYEVLVDIIQREEDGKRKWAVFYCYRTEGDSVEEEGSTNFCSLEPGGIGFDCDSSWSYRRLPPSKVARRAFVNYHLGKGGRKDE